MMCVYERGDDDGDAVRLRTQLTQELQAMHYHLYSIISTSLNCLSTHVT
jgi:hypothetical protein